MLKLKHKDAVERYILNFLCTTNKDLSVAVFRQLLEYWEMCVNNFKEIVPRSSNCQTSTVLPADIVRWCGETYECWCRGNFVSCCNVVLVSKRHLLWVALESMVSSLLNTATHIRGWLSRTLHCHITALLIPCPQYCLLAVIFYLDYRG